MQIKRCSKPLTTGHTQIENTALNNILILTKPSNSKSMSTVNSHILPLVIYNNSHLGKVWQFQ